MSKLNPEAREVAQHFCNEFKLKLLKKQFLAQLGCASALLNAGYTRNELFDLIDYAKKYKPDLYSLAYLQYVAQEWLASIKVAEAKEANFIIKEDIKENSSNQEKFNRTSKPVIKGTVKF